MNSPFYIAKRYLVAKKSQNIINIISGISIFGVTVGTMALIVILSVFNGFDAVITSLYNTFDPDLKITIKEGKSFSDDLPELKKIQNMEQVRHYTEIVEENALLRYDEKQYIARIKGVSETYTDLTEIDKRMVDGDFILKNNNRDYAVIGQGVAYYLSIGLNFINPIVIYVPKRTGQITYNPDEAFNRQYIYPSGIFAIEKEFDSKYIIVPLDFARDLLEYKNEVTAIELNISTDANLDIVQKDIQNILGENYSVKNRLQQNELFYKIMNTEKWAIFFILTFILIVASFNIIGSLTMLIIDKKHDIFILRSLGADLKFIRKIFLLEGWTISIAGSLLGLILGSILCLLQQHFEIIKLKGSSSFVINAYPVQMELTDVLYVFLTVMLIGFIAAWYPVRNITRRFLKNLEQE
jgi:lipoprotein-releasing system permease protein